MDNRESRNKLDATAIPQPQGRERAQPVSGVEDDPSRWAAAFVAIGLPLRAETIADFYKGRSVPLVIGFSVGGGYDAYARLLARYIGKNIPTSVQERVNVRVEEVDGVDEVTIGPAPERKREAA